MFRKSIPTLCDVLGKSAAIYPGKCLCGRVQFAVEGTPDWVAVEHSHFYRRSHACMNIAVAGYKPQKFVVTEGEGLLHRKPFDTIYKHTCKACGTHVYDDWLSYHKKVIFPPQLDSMGGNHKYSADWEAFHPQFHIHYNSAVCLFLLLYATYGGLTSEDDRLQR
eukprot:TRINITY_DN12999_c0_g1_i1.p1 TRINITY_DN12999_c0_g1~~TRINITY_DN12999_c0_g1_i1.p1  ORF type:complete len:175 (+),score=2.35 TRINITY_DN12999_c0_g1_i1:34-525(+)